jgi:hypothetical protein
MISRQVLRASSMRSAAPRPLLALGEEVLGAGHAGVAVDLGQAVRLLGHLRGERDDVGLEELEVGVLAQVIDRSRPGRTRRTG